ncbi:MAG TPA: hypothetical protein VF432_06715 [Thermoanaerobaculia bacterium]
MSGKRSVLAMVVLFSFPLSALSLLQTSAAQPAPPKQEAPLSNQDIIKLSKLQLGDDVVIAKIKQARSLAFDLSTDGLIQLKQASVSGKIIAAMLERATPQAAPAGGGTPGAGAAAGSSAHDVRLVINDQEVALPSSRGDLSVTGMWPVVFTFLDYPGRTARTRTTEVRPTLFINASHDPKSYYYLARLDKNDEEDNNRSLKIEQKASGFTATTRVIPAGRWHVEYDAAEVSPGVWRVTPNQDLQPGEYGVVVPGGILYEFGVD